jgi:hypothetical protein
MRMETKMMTRDVSEVVSRGKEIVEFFAYCLPIAIGWLEFAERFKRFRKGK